MQSPLHQPTATEVSPQRIEIPGGFFEPEGHIYRDAQGIRVLSVTQVFEMLGLVSYKGIDPEVLERKSQIGIAVHKAIEYLLQHKLDWDTVDEAAMNYVVGAELWFRNMKFELEACEQQGIHLAHGMKYGFQYDQRGSIIYQGRRRPVVVDLKTAVKESPTWALQTAGYTLAAPKIAEPYLRVVLHLQKDGRVKPLYYDDPQDEKTFLYMAYCAIWKQNHGLGDEVWTPHAA
jgi:hypothetical protein